jgi:multicomponent Na+:H+ antiporter subunit E
MKFFQFLSTAVFGAGVYLLIAGTLNIAELIAAFLIGTGASLLLFKTVTITPAFYDPRRIARALLYFPYFLWQMLIANLKIAAVVLSPSLPLKPSILKVKTGLNKNAGKLLLANSITLTPGTLTMDIREDALFIHCVQAGKKEIHDPVQTISGKFEDKLKAVSE